MAGGGGANKMSAAIGGVTGTFNSYPVLRRHDKLFDRIFRYSIIMVALWNRADHYIFILSFVLSSSFFFFSLPNLSRRRLDACHTSTHGVVLVRISDAGLKPATRGSLKTQDAKKSPKIAIWAPSHNFVGLYLRN